MVQLIKFHLMNLSWITFIWVKKENVKCIGLVKQ